MRRDAAADLIGQLRQLVIFPLNDASAGFGHLRAVARIVQLVRKGEQGLERRIFADDVREVMGYKDPRSTSLLYLTLTRTTIKVEVQESLF
jgi:hypothetical protein